MNRVVGGRLSACTCVASALLAGCLLPAFQRSEGEGGSGGASESQSSSSQASSVVTTGAGSSSSEATTTSATFANGTWTALSPSPSPGLRVTHAMTYDATSDRVLLFGGVRGENSTTKLNDTWAWDGSTWAQLSPLQSPPHLEDAMMASHGGRDVVLLFGGLDNGGQSTQETYLWDGSTWAQQSYSVRPPPRVLGVAAYDSARDEIVLFGGTDGNRLAPRYGDTWTWT
jgi:hypothetical protein